MLFEQLLNSYLGKHISDICLNEYTKDSDNHCAHFVSHVLTLNFGLTCMSMGKKKIATGANLRVHEVFARCPSVSEIISCDPNQRGLIFISAPKNFHKDKSSPNGHVLRNVPKKHIGILLNGKIWHYSNSKRQVVQQTIPEFIHHYRKQANALWWGEIPAGARAHPFATC